MTAPDYTLVVGVDANHLRQLSWTWPTCKKHKPTILTHSMIAFVDRDGMGVASKMQEIVDHPLLEGVWWPPVDMEYGGTGEDKWTSAQRHKMLAGFVHVPAFVATTYWLKLDLDVRDDWIDPAWFDGRPAIVAHPWTFTRPADQMDRLDAWVERNDWAMPELASKPSLDLHPLPGASRVGHRRVISWCGFFRTDFTTKCADWATRTCGQWKLPVPSQDGFLFYCAKRLGEGIVRQNFKGLGFEHWSSNRNVEKAAGRAMEDVR